MYTISRHTRNRRGSLPHHRTLTQVMGRENNTQARQLGPRTNPPTHETPTRAMNTNHVESTTPHKTSIRFPCRQHKHQEICGNIHRDKLSVPQWGNPFTPIWNSEPKALNNRNTAGGFGWALIEVKEPIHIVTDLRSSKENNCPACEPDSRFPCRQHKHQEICGNIHRIIFPTNSHQLGGHKSPQYSQGLGCTLNESPQAPPPRPDTTHLRHTAHPCMSAPAMQY